MHETRNHPTAPQPPAETGAKSPRQRKGNREKILAAATDLFREKGYFTVSMEDIASAANVSRTTVYRHFAGKAAVAGALFERAADMTTPVYLSIADGNFRDLNAVREWIVLLFATDRANRQLLRVFTQANADEVVFTERAQNYIGDVVAGLGRTIPAFNIDRNHVDGERHWLEAWLLVYELLDQSNRASWDRLAENEPLMIDILAHRFIKFVEIRSELL